MKKYGVPTLIKGLLIMGVLAVTRVYALPPLAPQNFVLKINGLEANVRWDSVDQADGYRLMYATYPDFNNIGFIELGTSTEYTRTLPNGAAFYVAIQAYNADGDSEFSTVEHFVLDKRIVVLLPLSGDEGALTLGLPSKAGIDAAIADGLWADHEQRVRWEIVDASSEIDRLKTLYYGNLLPETEEGQQNNLRGYIQEPNVLAVISSSTAASLALTSQKLENEPLVVAVTATSTILDKNENLLMLAASNELQAEKFNQKLSKDSETENRLLKYVIVLDSDPGIVAYSFDLYYHQLQKAFYKETAILQQAGLTGETSKPYAQLVGTLVFDGSEEQAEIIATTLDAIAPDVVFHIGFSAPTFPLLYKKRPNLTWISSDGTYNHEDYKDGDVMILSQGGEKGSFKNHGYDAVGFLAEVLKGLNDSELTKEKLLERAKQSTYQGRTGTKGFLKEKGWYEILKATATGWEIVK